MPFSQKEIDSIFFDKCSDLEEHTPEGLTNKEYALVALNCLDQAGLSLKLQVEVLQLLEKASSINWSDEE